MMRYDIPKACWACFRVSKPQDCRFFEKYQEAVYEIEPYHKNYSDVLYEQPRCKHKIK